MADTRVLIVEDDADINEIVATHLARCGMSCAQAFSGSEARLLIGADPFPFDVVVSDLMLPGLAGEDLVALIRKRDATVPIIVISARTAAADRIDLLKLGADDYLTKPFDLDELAVRIEVQLRHRARAAAVDFGAGDTDDARDGADDGEVGAPARLLRFRDWELDPDARAFWVAGTAVELTRIEFNILEALMTHPKHVFGKAGGALRGRVGRAVRCGLQHDQRARLQHSRQAQAHGNRRLPQDRVGHGLQACGGVRAAPSAGHRALHDARPAHTLRLSLSLIQPF